MPMHNNSNKADLLSQENLSCSMDPLNPEELRRQGHMVIDFIADYYQNIEKYPVLSQVEPGYLPKRLPQSAPNDPESIETILRDVQEHIIPGITHWQSPNYCAYFPSSGSTAGFLGEMLSTGFNVVGFNWISSPAATELESIVMDWFGEMLQLPKSFLFSGTGGGVIQGTTCEAILCTLVAARDQMLRQIGRNNIGKLVVYVSDQTHSAAQKAAQIAGIHTENLRVIETTKATSFALSPESLRTGIRSDMEAGLVPVFLCATVGTTATTAVDPVKELCEVGAEYGVWVHVDAAYAGSSCICPEFRHFLDGVEGAKSFTLNAHKWFFTPLDCCCLWVKDPKALTRSLTTNPEFLKNKATSSEQVVDYKDWQIALSRRFRSLKLWLVLRSYGVANLRSFLRNHVDMAKLFEELVRSDPRFEIVVPRNFSLVCFRALAAIALPAGVEQGIYSNGNHQILMTDDDDDDDDDHNQQQRANELNRELLERINRSGDLYMTHAVVGGVYFLRLAVGASLTQNRHVTMAWKVVQEHLHAISLHSFH